MADVLWMPHISHDILGNGKSQSKHEMGHDQS